MAISISPSHTVATNLIIEGNYVAGDPQITLNVLGQQANHLTITGMASGATNVVVAPFHGALPIFTGSIPIISDGPASTATFNAVQFPSASAGGNLVDGVEQSSPTQWDLTSRLNPTPIGAIAGGISSAVTSVATGFFQGTTAFLGAPAHRDPQLH